jgi:hypothetical protein
MSEPHSTADPGSSKPAKPYPDYPLFPHATRQWAKKIDGKMRYFGRWENPEDALQAYLDFVAGKVAEKSPSSTPTPATPDKPTKPSPGFPLFPHASGQWAKKLKGQIHYFGVWADPDAALAKYRENKDALHSGRTPRADPAALTVHDLVTAFLLAKQALVETGELSPRTWDGYKSACHAVVRQFKKRRLVADLGPDDFAALRNKLAQPYGPHGLGTAIQCIRCACK